MVDQTLIHTLLSAQCACTLRVTINHKIKNSFRLILYEEFVENFGDNMAIRNI